MSWSLESFATAQRERLQQIRTAAEKEEAALRTSDALTHRGAAHGSPLRDGGEKSMLPRSHVTIERLEARQSAELASLQEEERAVDLRLSRAESSKRDLIATLISLQYREKELNDREKVLDEDEEVARGRQEEVRSRLREVALLSQQLDHDVAERVSRLQLLRAKHTDKVQAHAHVVQKLRQQLHDHEDRIRGLEAQLNSKTRQVEDFARDVDRQAVAQRDAELQSIEELRSDIERCRVAFGVLV